MDNCENKNKAENFSHSLAPLFSNHDRIRLLEKNLPSKIAKNPTYTV